MKVPYPELPQADLCVGAVYLQEEGQLRGEPIQALGFSNMGGFRPRGGWTVPAARAVALFSTGDQQEWPDHRDLADGTFTYYGDNRAPAGR